MMREIARRFLRLKLGSVGTLIALGLLAVLQAFALNAGGTIGTTGTLAVVVIAAGCVSRDAASGALQMILARPIRRTDYLAGQYVGILLLSAMVLVAAILIAAGMGEIITGLMPPGAPRAFSLAAAVRGSSAALLDGALTAAVFLLFSTFLRGWGDALAFLLGATLLGAIQALGQALNRPTLTQIGRWASQNLYPSVAWDTLLQKKALDEAAGRYLLALLLYATLAAVVFSRREFSYGRD